MKINSKLNPFDRLRVDPEQSRRIKIQSSKLLIILLIIFIGYLFFISSRNSLVFRKKDRLNIVFYGPKITFYSIGFDDGVNYFISYPSEVKTLVPGGFGYYRLGGLGKLITLEKQPELYKRSFSTINSNFIDLYFYPVKNEVYYNKEETQVSLPSLSQLATLNSNANIFDRIYVLFIFASRQKSQFLNISYLPVKKGANGEILDERIFSDRLIGYFYQKTYRNENKNVQIIYKDSEENARLIAKIIEGQGIRVVDFAYRNSKNTNCQIIINEKKVNRTAEGLRNFFNCPIVTGETSPYDIIFVLGQVERQWEVGGQL